MTDPRRRAILVTSFGTSFNENRARTIDVIESRIAANHPDWECRRAFTSRMIIRKLRERDGMEIDFITDALARLADEGFDTVVVQPTYIMNGIEYELVEDAVGEYRDRFAHISLGTPLLTEDSDYDDAVSAIEADIIPAAAEVAGEGAAVVMMGHGTEHHANAAYCQLQLKLMAAGHRNVFMTTVEGFPTFEDTADIMEGLGFTDVVLLPFMLVAGDHANNDMAGDEEDSLRSYMESRGYRVHCIVKGLGEFPAFEDLFGVHADKAIAELGGPE